MDADGDVVRRRLDARHFERLTLVHDELKDALDVALDGRARDLAVALQRVRIAGGENAALHVHRQIERSADRDLAQIEISAVHHRGRAGGELSHRGRRRDAHLAQVRLQRHLDRRAKTSRDYVPGRCDRVSSRDAA